MKNFLIGSCLAIAPAFLFQSAVADEACQSNSLICKIDLLTSKVDELSKFKSTLDQSVVAFASNDCPDGWEKYKPAYGRFLRGIDHNASGIDPSGKRPHGNEQLDAIQAHIHDLRNVKTAGHAGGVWPHGYQPGDKGATVPHSGPVKVNSSESRVAPETRPRNIAVTFCKVR